MRPLPWLTLLGLGAAVGAGACSRDIEGDVAGECTDGADNDRDGAFDCDDSDCAGAPACKGVQPNGGSGGDGGSASTTEWLEVASGGVHNCGIQADGTLLCWGNAADGQSTPPAGTFTHASVSFFHSCAVDSAGALACWGCKGTKDYGQCDVPAGLFAVGTFDTGTYATCAVSTGGAVQCWGCVGANQGQCTPTAVTLDTVAVGSLHACGISEGTPICWGNGDYGQSTPPTMAFVQLDTGTWHTCGVRDDATIACWGCSSPGPTQPADFGQCDSPAGTFDQVAVGVYHSCGLRTDGTIACWGCIGDHDGTATDAGQCDPPAGSYKAIGVGKYHGCAQRADDTLVCWGDNFFGQLEVP